MISGGVVSLRMTELGYLESLRNPTKKQIKRAELLRNARAKEPCCTKEMIIEHIKQRRE